MTPSDRTHAENLRMALLKLKPSGPDGFEGLLALILARLFSQPFRLASSGAQRGRDGDSAFDQGATYFEGKRYDGKLSKTEVAAKAFDLVADDRGQVDLWMLGVTSEVGSQDRDDIKKYFSQVGIGVHVLDWSDTDIGALLVAVVAGGNDTKAFLQSKLAATPHAGLVADASAAIDYFTEDAAFASRLVQLKAGLSTEAAGLGLAKAGNESWLHSVFESRVQARMTFGQPLAPLDPDGVKPRTRSAEQALEAAFVGTPPAEPYAVIGEEGAGKSWLVVRSWLGCHPRSLLVICTADDFLEMAQSGDFDNQLIKRLIRQTAGHETAATINRWQRRLRMWRQNPQPENVRLALVIDGLNQTGATNWGRYIDGIGQRLRELGGSLVLTTRAGHWAQIRTSLASAPIRVLLENWSADELNELLRTHGINGDMLSADTFETLRNPRIFGIAVELLAARDIEQIDELSVERLMFEHMRQSEQSGTSRLSGQEFSGLLRKLAQEVLDRGGKHEKDDLHIFDADQIESLRAVASCQFFQPLRRDPNLYRITSPGLDLGLALWLIAALEREFDNDRHPRGRLASILEPISALDETGRVVQHAVQLACVDENTSMEVRAALIEHFVSLQNLPRTTEAKLTALGRRVPEAFLQAAEHIHTAKLHVPNADLLLHALLAHRRDTHVWQVIVAKVEEWLSHYSLAPERMMFKVPGRDPETEVAEEREKRQLALDKSLAALTGSEKAYIASNLVQSEHPDYNALHRFAFFLLAGQPLARFAPYFVRWSFADALSPILYSPDKEFRQLVRFNPVDWSATREALLVSLDAIEDRKASDVGKWARVEILRATGDVDDAANAEALAEWLTRDRERFGGWSLLENYCANDPCDPSSVKPDNIDETAEKYRIVDPFALATSMGPGTEDHLFNMARPGVVRFRPADALLAHRTLASNVLGRTGFKRRQGVLALRSHSAAQNRQIAIEFLKAGQASKAALGGDTQERDEWLTAQFSILAALPHLTPSEQWAAIDGMNIEMVLVDILNAITPASASEVEDFLQGAVATGDEKALARIMAVVHYSRPQLSQKTLQMAAQLTLSTIDLVRSFALGICAASNDKDALGAVVASGWTASSSNGKRRGYEAWYGSQAILEAAKKNLLSLDEALNRMSLGHFGFAAIKLGPAASVVIAERLEQALDSALEIGELTDLPEMRTRAPDASDTSPPIMSLDEAPVTNVEAQVARFNESREDHDKRQKRLGRAFGRFVKQLSAAEADLILDDLTLEGTIAILAASPDVRLRVLGKLSAAADSRLRHLHHIAIQVGIACALVGLPEGASLLRRTINLDPTVRRVQGIVKLPVETVSLWRHADNAVCAKICEERLTTLDNDRDLSLEILAALINGKHATVMETIDHLLATWEPAKICRAITIAGFSDTHPQAADVLDRFAGVVSLRRRPSALTC